MIAEDNLEVTNLARDVLAEPNSKSMLDSRHDSSMDWVSERLS